MASQKIVLAQPVALSKEQATEELKRLAEKAQANLFEALSPNTRRAYASQWKLFEQWCATFGQPPAPATSSQVLAYLTHRAEQGVSVSTLDQSYGAIIEYHRLLDMKLPTLDGREKRSWTGARKSASRARPVEEARALLVEELKELCYHLVSVEEDDSLALRDRAVFLIGFAGALRRDEISGLNVGDISETAEGLRVMIRHSKTDQEGLGYELGIAFGSDPAHCPARTWKAYLQGRLEFEGPLAPDSPAFVSVRGNRISGGDVDRRLKKHAKAVGLNLQDLSAHSLRAGCATAAADAGHSLDAIQRQTRHKSVNMLMRYIRKATVFKDNVTEGLL